MTELTKEGGFLAAWYAVFCTLTEMHEEKVLSDQGLVYKMLQLRKVMIAQAPELEEMYKNRQENRKKN